MDSAKIRCSRKTLCKCSGFIYGLQMAQAFVESGMYENILLVGAELHSNALEYNDRGRAVTLFLDTWENQYLSIYK